MLKYNVVFWTVSTPLIPIALGLVVVALLNPINRYGFMNVVEAIVYKMCAWRNNLPIVKFHYEKAHLFDMLRDSEG